MKPTPSPITKQVVNFGKALVEEGTAIVKGSQKPKVNLSALFDINIMQ
jgi:hypothetical protein